MASRVTAGLALVASALTLGCPRRPAETDAAFTWDIGRSFADARNDAPGVDTNRDASRECAAVSVRASVTRLPVDIIFVVDNSSSMQPAIEGVQTGLNEFARRLASSGLDYRLIVLSLRGRGRTTVDGSTLYQLCVPEPVAGPNCADNAPRFHQVELNVKSTQPLEQILGTLAQSNGYRDEGSTGPRDGGPGSAPWRHLLRPNATKSFVVVTDDNARLNRGPMGCYDGGWGGTQPSAVSGSTPFDQPEDFETYPGGRHPFGGADRVLGPGILTAGYTEPDARPLFEGYTFSAIYGWGSETSDRVACGECGTSGDAVVSSPGPTYTALVRRTGGVRAQLCDGAAAFGPFFDELAETVDETSRIECEVELPEAPAGMTFDSNLVNVTIRSGATVTVPRVTGVSRCGATGGWYYDDPEDPTSVVLCPASCETAREAVRMTDGGLDVRFGCESVIL